MVLLQKQLKAVQTANITSYKNFFVLLFLVLVLAVVSVLILQYWSNSGNGAAKFEKLKLINIRNLPEVKLSIDDEVSSPRNPKCTHWNNCFNVYRCGRTGHDRISVYVYPLRKYVDADGVPAVGVMSKEYYMILESIIDSKYYTANPYEACLFVPPIDTLNQDRIRGNLTSKALHSLPQYALTHRKLKHLKANSSVVSWLSYNVSVMYLSPVPFIFFLQMLDFAQNVIQNINSY